MAEAINDSVVVSVVLVVVIGAASLWWWFSTSNDKNSSAGRLQRALQNAKLDITKIAADCQKENQLWKDPAFGHDPYPGPSIGYTLELRQGERGRPLRLGKAGVTWQPPSRFAATPRPMGIRGDGVPTWLYSDVDGDGVVSAAEGMGLGDAAQGSVGDCYFLSALAAAVQNQPDLCDDLIDETYEEQGIYGVSFWIRGKWRMIWVDSYFPCYRPDSKSHRGKYRLIFAKPTDNKEIWPIVVEKAFAKVSGSYEAISGGQIAAALELLTGHRAGTRSVRMKSRSEWEQFKEQVLSDECLVGAGSQPAFMDQLEATEQTKRLKGIVTGHAYTLVNLYEDENLRLLELRNPWGRGEWEGEWGRGSRKWDTEEGRKVLDVVGPRRNEDGRFWMPFDDFVACFHSIDVCHLTFTPEERERRAALAKEAARIIAEKDKPSKKNSSGEGAEYTQESADAMMELLIAEEAKEKRMKQIGCRGNKRSAKKRS